MLNVFPEKEMLPNEPPLALQIPIFTAPLEPIDEPDDNVGVARYPCTNQILMSHMGRVEVRLIFERRRASSDV